MVRRFGTLLIVRRNYFGYVMSQTASSEREPDQALISKLVSAAKALVTYQVGLPVGIARISKIVYWLGWHTKDEFEVLTVYGSETNDLPVGTERLLTERNALRRFDKRLERINASYRDEIFELCYSIIDRYDRDGGALRELEA